MFLFFLASPQSASCPWLSNLLSFGVPPVQFLFEGFSQRDPISPFKERLVIGAFTPAPVPGGRFHGQVAVFPLQDSSTFLDVGSLKRNTVLPLHM